MANVTLEQETEREAVDEIRDTSAMEVRLCERALEELKVMTDVDIRNQERGADAPSNEREAEMRKIELDMEMRKID